MFSWFHQRLQGCCATLEQSKKAKDALSAYLIAATPPTRAISVTQPGWSAGLFVMPDAVYGRTSQRVVFQTKDPEDIKRFSKMGSLESWKHNVATPCIGNSRAVMSICVGLAPPLLGLLGEDNGGFHLRGNSSCGKTICLAIGASVWGSNSLIRTWLMTTNGFETVATMHNDVLLPLDELGQADGKAAGAAAYMLGNGQGKSRADKKGDARTSKRFRNLVLSSGEKSLADLMAQAGQTAMAGQEVRMVEITADVGCGYGIFEDIHGASSSQAFAESLRHAVKEHHGQAGRAFVQLLADEQLRPGLLAKVKTLIQQFVADCVPAAATGQVQRVGQRFGLVAAAGELCIELGILPWAVGEAIAACRKCFDAWVEKRGGIGNHEAEQAISKVRHFFEQHGESRFTLIQGSTEVNVGSTKTINRAGFREVHIDGRTDFFVLPEVYRTQVCEGMNSTYVTKVLVENGFLATSASGKAQIDKRLPIGKAKIYHVKADILGESVSHSEKEETDGRQETLSKYAMKFRI